MMGRNVDASPGLKARIAGASYPLLGAAAMIFRLVVFGVNEERWHRSNKENIN